MTVLSLSAGNSDFIQPTSHQLHRRVNDFRRQSYAMYRHIRIRRCRYECVLRPKHRPALFQRLGDLLAQSRDVNAERHARELWHLLYSPERIGAQPSIEWVFGENALDARDTERRVMISH